MPSIADGATAASALSVLLKGGSTGAGGGASSGKQLQIRVFGQPIPGDPMVVLVPEAATMAEVISLLLDLVSPNPNPNPKPNPNPNPDPALNPAPNPNEVISLVLDQYVRVHSCEALCLESVDFELLMVRARVRVRVRAKARARVPTSSY